MLKERPPKLRQADTIGVVSLASPPNESPVKYIRYLQGLGYKVVLGKTFWSTSFPTASSKERAYDLMDMFTNPKVKMILPLRGGTGSADVLPYLDFNVIKQNPKIFSAYSDFTLLLNTLYQRTGLFTIHGLMLKDFDNQTPAFNFNHFFSTVSTTHVPRQITNPQSMRFITKVSGVVRGKLVGGNITSLVDSLGTSYQVDTKNKILFLEDVGEATSRMYRKITHLKRAGIFKECIGIIIGQCTDCSTAYHLSFEKIIDDVLVPLGKPLLANLATGHGSYKVTLPIGTTIALDSQKKTITVLEPSVSNV